MLVQAAIRRAVPPRGGLQGAVRQAQGVVVAHVALAAVTVPNQYPCELRANRTFV